jgi:hypothetical protein
VLIAAHRDGDGLSGRDCTLRQIGGETNGLAIVPGPEGIRQLGAFRGYGTELEGSIPAKKNGDQTRTEEQAETIREGFDDGGYVGSPVQGVRDLGEDLGSAVLLA